VEVVGYLLEELRDAKNYALFQTDVQTANIFIGSLIFIEELAEKVGVARAGGARRRRRRGPCGRPRRRLTRPHARARADRGDRHARARPAGRLPGVPVDARGHVRRPRPRRAGPGLVRPPHACAGGFRRRGAHARRPPRAGG